MDLPRDLLDTRTTSSSSKKFIYAVIEFSGDGTMYVSTCPLSWIKGNTCSWPSKKGIERKAILNQMTPEKDWSILEDITILGKYESYKEALHYEKKKTLSSADESSSDDVKNQKRKIKKNSKYRDDSVSPPPSHEVLWENDDPVEDPPTPPPAHIGEPQFNAVESFSNPSDNLFSQIINDAEITILNNDRSNADIWQLLNEMKVQQDLIIDRLAHIERVIAALNNVGITRHQSNQILPNLPLNTVVELHEFNEQLKNEEPLQECLLNYLQFIGGNEAKLCTYRCLERLFSNYLGQFCSWTGKGGNVKLCDMQLIHIIKKAVRTSFPDMTDHLFEGSARAWFNHAKTRFLRENKTTH